MSAFIGVDSVAAVSSSSPNLNTSVTIQYFKALKIEENEQFQFFKQICSFAKHKLLNGLLIVEKDQQNYEQVNSKSIEFQFISTVTSSIFQFPQKLLVIASDGKMNAKELSLVKQSLSAVVKQKEDLNQIESMTYDSSFVYIFHGYANQYSLEINPNQCIIQLKYNTISQSYSKQFDFLKASVIDSQQSNPLYSNVDYHQTVIYEVSIKNNGIIAWPQHIQLFSSVHPNCNVKSGTPIPSLLPNEKATIKIEVEYSKIEFNHNSQYFQFATKYGQVFGDVISITPVTTMISNLISVGLDLTIKVWDISSQELITTCYNASTVNSTIPWDKERVLIAYANGDVKIWNIVSRESEYTFSMAHTKNVTCLHKLNQYQFVSGSDDNNLKLWDMQTKQCIHTLKGHTNTVTCISKLNQEILVSASDDQTIKLWKIANGSCINTIKTNHSAGISSLAVLQNNQFIISASDDATVKIWNCKTFECVGTLRGHSDGISSVIFLNDNQVISGSDDKTIRIWNNNTWECESVIQNDSEVHCLVKINQQIFASGDDNGIIKLWDVTSKECIVQWKAHKKWINSLVV